MPDQNQFAPMPMGETEDSGQAISLLQEAIAIHAAIMSGGDTSPEAHDQLTSLLQQALVALGGVVDDGTDDEEVMAGYVASDKPTSHLTKKPNVQAIFGE